MLFLSRRDGEFMAASMAKDMHQTKIKNEGGGIDEIDSY